MKKRNYILVLLILAAAAVMGYAQTSYTPAPAPAPAPAPMPVDIPEVSEPYEDTPGMGLGLGYRTETFSPAMSDLNKNLKLLFFKEVPSVSMFRGETISAGEVMLKYKRKSALVVSSQMWHARTDVNWTNSVGAAMSTKYDLYLKPIVVKIKTVLFRDHMLYQKNGLYFTVGLPYYTATLKGQNVTTLHNVVYPPVTGTLYNTLMGFEDVEAQGSGMALLLGLGAEYRVWRRAIISLEAEYQTGGVMEMKYNVNPDTTKVGQPATYLNSDGTVGSNKINIDISGLTLGFAIRWQI